MATGVVGQTASSPYFNPGTQFNTSTGQVIGTPNFAKPTASTAPAFQVGGWYGGKQWNGSSFGNVGQVTMPNAAQSGGGGQQQSSGGNQQQGQQNPQPPDLSVFDNIINPVISNFESLIGQQQTASQNQIGGLNAQRTNEVNQATQSQTDQTNSLNTQSTNQTDAANNAIEEAKRMYSEMAQGTLARYGTTTGTGAFLTEQLGQSTGRNIALLHQGLTQSLQDINDKITQVKSAGQLAIQGINTNFDNAIQTEQDNLQKYIVQIRGNEAMLQSNKAQMAAQAIQHYQDTVNNINAQRAQMTQQYAIAALNAQTQLQIYGQKGSALLQQIQSNTPNYLQIGTQGMGPTTNVTPQTPTTPQDQGLQSFNTQQPNAFQQATAMAGRIGNNQTSNIA